MAKVWSGHEVDFIRRHLHEDTKDIVALFNEEYEPRTYNSIQKQVKRLRDHLAAMQDEQEDDLLDQVVQPRQLHIPGVSTADKRANRQTAEEWLRELIEVSNREAHRMVEVRSSRSVDSEKSSLVVLLSDTHFGKHTSFYNLKLARARMCSIPSMIQEFPIPELDEVVLVLAGDMVEGEDIYATQNNKIECPVFEQTQACTHSIWETVLLFREMFKCRVRVETVPGNHGRMSKTANEKSNWDNVVYHTLRLIAHLHGDNEIVINANFDTFTTFRVKDKVGAAYHKGVKHTGTPAMQLKVAGWSNSKHFDFLVHGHWHEWHVGNWLGKFVIANGCMCGPDDLSEEMAKEDNPRQAFFFITPGKPIHGHSFVEWPSLSIESE